MMIEMTVAGIALDARTGHPIVVLNDSSKRRALPIWIGMFEANAITRALENFKPERPMTHDLLLSSIQQLGYRVKHIEINELSSNTYFATIVLQINDPTNKLAAENVKPIDARPSDAIALALRAKAPIFVAPQVVAEGTIPADFEKDEEEAEEFKKFVDNLKASDFKKFRGEEGGPSEGFGGGKSASGGD
jgi:bifunctional DNase/RNase